MATLPQPAMTSVAILTAGGCVPANLLNPTTDGETDALVARTFRHPALGDRPVVQLVPNLQLPGVDAELETLGFSAVGEPAVVGVVRRRALGFPGWALVHDPKRAKYALGILKQFKQAAARVATKPGHARDEFNAIADKLGREVPHFLPSFWEEAARAFLAAGSTAMAASAFDKARQAEAHHALKVDERQRSAAFLEFALSGAIAVKSLAAHAKDLERQHGAVAAYPVYRDLCVRAVRGGVPPWAAMAADLRKLAKSAGVPTEAADRELVRALVGASSLGRAPAEFWKGTRKAWVVEGKADQGVRDALLSAWPGLVEDDDEFLPTWLALLADAGCLEKMTAAKSRDHEPLGGPAGWLSRLLQKTEDPPTVVFTWVRKLAARLRTEGSALRFEDDDWHREYPVDLLDLCLELGVPVADPSSDASLDLRTWAAAKSEEGETRPRNPAWVVADPRFSPLVPAAVARAFDDDDFVKVAPGKPALTEARRAYLLGKTRDIAHGFHATIAAAIGSLQEEVPEATLREFPEAMAQLRAVDFAPRLAAQLRAGVFDEWAWPAWDAALRELGGDDPDDVTRSGAWPYVVLHDAKQAIVLGPAGEHCRHVFRLPAKARLRRTLFADGQLLVVFRDKDYDTKAYWSAKPNEVFDFSDEYELPRGEAAAALLADGSLCLGGRALHAADSKVESNFPVFADLTGVWRPLEDDDGDEDDDGKPRPSDGLPRLQELNPATGDLGRRSWPAAMARLAQPGWELRVDASSLLPAPPGLQRSPLGLADGLIGCVVRRAADLGDTGDVDRYHLQRIDGVEWSGDTEDTPVGLLPVHSTHRWHYVVENGHTGNLHAAESGELLENLDDDAPLPGVWTRIPPRACWHYLTVRDESGGARLRQLDDETARRWLGLAAQDLTGTAGKAAQPGGDLLNAVRTYLGTASDLATGVAHWALRFAKVASDLLRVTQGAAAEQGDDTQDLLSPRVNDNEAMAAFGKVAHDSRYASEDLTQQLGAVVRMLTGPDDQPPRACAQSDLAWFGWLGNLRALAFRLTGVYGDDQARDHGGLVFAALLQTPLVDDLQLRVCNVQVKDPNLPWLLRDDDDDDPSFANAWTFATAGHRYLVRHDNWWDEDEGIELQLLELRGAHDWALPAGATLDGDGDGVIHTAGGERAWLQDFLALLAERGAPKWDFAVPAALAERAGMAPAVAALLWAGMPQINEWAHDFLGKELREKLGVKLPDAAKAKETLSREDDDALRTLYGAAAAGDPAELWAPLQGEPSPVDRMAASWKATHTAHDAALAELLGLVDAALPDLNDAQGALAALTNPAESPVLNSDALWCLDRDGDPICKGEGDPFGADLLVDCARLLAWLGTQLPAGHAARKTLPLALTKLRDRLRNPNLLLPIGRWDTESPKDAKALKALVKSLGGEPYALPKGEDDDDVSVKAFDTGRLVYVLGEDYADFALRPAHVQALAADDLVFKLAEHCYCGTDHLPAALAFVLSDDATALADRAANTPLPDGGWEMDPRSSTPHLVDAAAQKLGLTRDAAGLYLQLLALAEPTTKNLQTWNGQTAAQLKVLLQVLRDQNLVLQAKRPRAGREDFLPGGWDARKAPDLPLETWKVPLYWQGEAPPLGRVLPLRPVHVVLETAWARVVAGDVPKYG